MKDHNQQRVFVTIFCAYIVIVHILQDIKNNGGPGYKYITVEEDEAANVVYCNNTLVHLANEQIPKGFAVSYLLVYQLLVYLNCSYKLFRQ